ncbi:MAG: heme ABC exporter ATP-binding protein CcmA [Coriobacteriia bacterium]|nr:heme ABC exporter ATP-binding protein CcmA [Coriobacteriia bacterium]
MASPSKKDPATPAVELQSLTRNFGVRTALNKLDLTLPAGAFLTIFGHNGAGKTTLLRILATIEQASSGEAKVLGFSTKTEADEIRARIGFISHQPLLYADLTAEENLLFFARLYGVENAQEKTRALLAKTGLASRSLDVARTFSRGMIQRLSLARALLHDPELILLDEPYTGLDPQGTETLNALIDEIRDERSFILVSHHLESGLERATHVLTLDKGRIQFYGTRNEYENFVDATGKTSKTSQKTSQCTGGQA